MNTAKIKVRNLIAGGIQEYPDLDALILNTCEWYGEVEGQIDVSMDDRFIILEYTHYDSTDSDTVAVIILDELPHVVNARDLFEQLKACG